MRASLPLGELEPGAGATLSIFLSLLHARIARQETRLLQDLAKLSVENEEGTRNAVADRSGLPRASAAIHEGDDVELVHGLRQLQRLAADHLEHVVRKVVFEG